MVLHTVTEAQTTVDITKQALHLQAELAIRAQYLVQAEHVGGELYINQSNWIDSSAPQNGITRHPVRGFRKGNQNVDIAYFLIHLPQFHNLNGDDQHAIRVIWRKGGALEPNPPRNGDPSYNNGIDSVNYLGNLSGEGRNEQKVLEDSQALQSAMKQMFPELESNWNAATTHKLQVEMIKRLYSTYGFWSYSLHESLYDHDGFTCDRILDIYDCTKDHDKDHSDLKDVHGTEGHLNVEHEVLFDEHINRIIELIDEAYMNDFDFTYGSYVVMGSDEAKDLLGIQ